jgi:hypothetical protein
VLITLLRRLLFFAFRGLAGERATDPAQPTTQAIPTPQANNKKLTGHGRCYE